MKLRIKAKGTIWIEIINLIILICSEMNFETMLLRNELINSFTQLHAYDVKVNINLH